MGEGHKDIPSIDKTTDDYVDGIIIVVDFTGLKVYDRGEWIREIYGLKVRRKRGFIKMHVSFDIRKILSLRVTDERVRDHKMFKELVEETLEKYNVYRVLAEVVSKYLGFL